MNIFAPRVIQVIVNYDLRGDGTANSPYRRVVQYLDFDGNVLSEAVDECAAQNTAELSATDSQHTQHAIAALRETLSEYAIDIGLVDHILNRYPEVLQQHASA